MARRAQAAPGRRVEEDTNEAFLARRQLAKLLVAGIAAGNRREDGGAEIRITYRFGPPPSDTAGDGGEAAGDYSSEGSFRNGNRS